MRRASVEAQKARHGDAVHQKTYFASEFSSRNLCSSGEGGEVKEKGGRSDFGRCRGEETPDSEGATKRVT
jgi:hypothetical protein